MKTTLTTLAILLLAVSTIGCQASSQKAAEPQYIEIEPAPEAAVDVAQAQSLVPMDGVLGARLPADIHWEASIEGTEFLSTQHPLPELLAFFEAQYPHYEFSDSPRGFQLRPILASRGDVRIVVSQGRTKQRVIVSYAPAPERVLTAQSLELEQ